MQREEGPDSLLSRITHIYTHTHTHTVALSFDPFFQFQANYMFFFFVDMNTLSFSPPPYSFITRTRLKMKQKLALSPIPSPLPEASTAVGSNVIQLTLGPSMSTLKNCRTTTNEKNNSPKEVNNKHSVKKERHTRLNKWSL